ncbi:YadA-like family protein [Photobacterium sp. TY1-4]|uniref:YadA-like family protein n=1 Tax=Photobacterium sp. TY1-4 TaxID=2899122 RepID=UPI0021BEB88F|nr:YadA-like family protein [Photobacterium sp. TY1-4]UXI03381.1 YadA-like family protein [Photobacterium sp. TY1-4]
MISANTNKISTNAHAITAANTAISANTDAITTANTAISANTDAITTANTAINANTDKISTNADAITAANTVIKANTDAIATANSEIAANNTAITSESNERKTADQQLEQQITAASTEIANNVSDINALYETTADHDARISDNTKRIRKIEFQVQDLYSEVKRLDGAIAASTAVGSMITPRYQGDTVISVGMGHYNGSSALAIGTTHNMSESVALRATIAGSDADNWAKPIFGASANWAF